MSRRTPASRAARILVTGLLGRVRDGAVIIKDGHRSFLCGRPVAGERVPEVRVLSPRAWRLVATDGSAGLGRAYFEGLWTCDDLDDVTALIRVVVRNLDAIERASRTARRLGMPFSRLLKRRDRPGDPAVDRRNVRAHYDLGNDFFATFLDETMTYSCALFASSTTSLRDAQVAKLDRLCRKLELSPADHVLEVGTGWGSFAIHAASTYGCRVTTTTISAQQYELATREVKRAGLEELVTVLKEDYRELEGTYDKLVSIEMIEALDWRQYDTYFSSCERLLAPDGLMAIQAIVMADQYYERAKRTEDFIKRYVFPGSCLPSITTIVETATRASDLRVIALDDVGHHYAQTLKCWRANLTASNERLDTIGVDETTRRLFEFYFCYCEAAFAERRISDVQCVLARGLWRPRALRSPTP